MRKEWLKLDVVKRTVFLTVDSRERGVKSTAGTVNGEGERQKIIDKLGSSGHHGTRNPRLRSGCVLRSTSTPADTTINAKSVPIFDRSANVPISQMPAGIPTTNPATQVLTCGVRKRV